jgi:hypothetical protein
MDGNCILGCGLDTVSTTIRRILSTAETTAEKRDLSRKAVVEDTRDVSTISTIVLPMARAAENSESLESSESALSVGATAGIGIGVPVAALLVVALWYMYRRRKHPRHFPYRRRSTWFSLNYTSPETAESVSSVRAERKMSKVTILSRLSRFELGGQPVKEALRSRFAPRPSKAVELPADPQPIELDAGTVVIASPPPAAAPCPYKPSPLPHVVSPVNSPESPVGLTLPSPCVAPKEHVSSPNDARIEEITASRARKAEEAGIFHEIKWIPGDQQDSPG